MNKYFIEILRNRTLLTIPKFGALTVANRKTGKIVFNPNLTFDDNVLSDYIAEKDGVDKIEAKNIIAKFVREIEAILDKGDTYDIFQFGKFYKNDKGEIVFESTIENIEKIEKPVPSTDGKEEPLEETTEVKKTKENIYIPPVVEKIDDVKEKTKEKLESSLDDIKNKYKKTEGKVVKEAKDAKEEIVTAVSSSADDIKNKFKKSNKKTEKPKKEKKVKDKGEKKKRRVLPLILLLLLLGGIGVGGFLYQDKIKELIGLSKTAEHTVDDYENDKTSENHDNENAEVDDETNTEQTATKDEIVAENVESETDEVTVDETENVVEEVVEEKNQPESVTTVNSSINGNYHIIGGAFGEESNATNYADKTGGKVLGKFNGLYQVAIKSYDTRTEANTGLKQLSSEYPSAWILKYPK
jgi:hypothetical protein